MDQEPWDGVTERRASHHDQFTRDHKKTYAALVAATITILLGTFTMVGTVIQIGQWKGRTDFRLDTLEFSVRDRYTKGEAIANDAKQDIRIERSERDIQSMLLILKEINHKVDQIIR